MVETLLKALTELNTDKSAKRWSPLTRHRAPHKPFLLLSLLDLVSQDLLPEPSIC